MLRNSTRQARFPTRRSTIYTMLPWGADFDGRTTDSNACLDFLTMDDDDAT
jgi:hypothetical protein